MKYKLSVVILSAAGLCILACQQDPPSSAVNSPLPQALTGSGTTSANPAIAYGDLKSVKSGRTTTTYPTVVVMDTDGSHATTIYTSTTSSSTAAASPGWSPSGGSISFIEGTHSIRAVDVSVVNGVPTGSNSRTIVTDTRTLYEQAWSSTSTTNQIAYVTIQPISGNLGSGRLYTVSASGGTATLLYSSNDTVTHRFDNPTWSPDDRYIAFMDRAWRNSSQSHSTMLRIVNASTGAMVDSADLSNLYLPLACEWARSGNTIAFSSADTNVNPHSYIYYYTAFSGNSYSTQNTSGDNPTWSPNDATIMLYYTANNDVVGKIDAFGTSHTSIPNGNSVVKWKR